MAKYKIIRKMYRSIKDMECGNPHKIVDLCSEPVCKRVAEILLPKMMTDKLWINQIVAA